MSERDLRGQRFGPMVILCRWGAQSGNVAWTYYCRACGHLGHRLGTAFRRGDTECPRCGSGSPKRPHAPPPTREQLDAFMAAAPDRVARTDRRGPWRPPPKRRGRVGLTKPVDRCTDEELFELRARIEFELGERDLNDHRRGAPA